MSFDTYLYKGTRESINPNLIISYQYDFNPDGPYQTIKEKKKGGYIINPSYGIMISEGFSAPWMFIQGGKYYSFVTLLEKAITLVSENLYEIFPNINKIEFEIDSRVLERFQTEKALSTMGMTAMPTVWTNQTSECFPGIKISSKNGTVTIPLEDAIPIKDMLKHFDPICYSISMLRFFGKIE